MKPFFQRFFLRPPIFFPLLALFHWLMAVVHFMDAEALEDKTYLSIGLWKVVAAILCTALTLLKRWSGIAYVLLTSVGYSLYYFNRETNKELAHLGTCMFPLDIIVCFLILFFYKRLEGWPARAK